MRRSSTVRLMVRQAHHAAHDEACVDDFCDHVGGRPAQRALTGAISIAIQPFRNAPSSIALS